MRIIKFLCLLSLFAGALSSCYRMPGDDEYSTIPTINNPDITRHKESSEPQMKY